MPCLAFHQIHEAGLADVASLRRLPLQMSVVVKEFAILPDILPPDELQRQLSRTARFLESNKISYMLGGAMALGHWGRPRATVDVDFWIMLDSDRMEKFRKDVKKAGFPIDEEWHRVNPMLGKSHLRLIPQDVPVDLMLPKDSHDAEALARRKVEDLQGESIYLIAPEDLLLHKLKAGRFKDYDDAISIAERMRGRLDLEYMRDWASRWRLTGELEHLLGENT